MIHPQNNRHYTQHDVVACVLLVCLLWVYALVANPGLHQTMHPDCDSHEDCPIELFLSGAAVAVTLDVTAPGAPKQFEVVVHQAPPVFWISKTCPVLTFARGPPAVSTSSIFFHLKSPPVRV